MRFFLSKISLQEMVSISFRFTSFLFFPEMMCIISMNGGKHKQKIGMSPVLPEWGLWTGQGHSVCWPSAFSPSMCSPSYVTT